MEMLTLDKKKFVVIEQNEFHKTGKCNEGHATTTHFLRIQKNIPRFKFT